MDPTPDNLVRNAGEHAVDLGKPRSEADRDALDDHIGWPQPRAVTEALNDLAEELTDDADGFSAVAARQTLERNEW